MKASQTAIQQIYGQRYKKVSIEYSKEIAVAPCLNLFEFLKKILSNSKHWCIIQYIGSLLFRIGATSGSVRWSGGLGRD